MIDFHPIVKCAPIPGFPGYLALSDGRIWSARLRKKFLKPQVASEKIYRHVSLYDQSGKQITRLIHRVHMSAFHGRQLARDEVVEHINHVGTDNRWENLRVTTQKENIARGRKDGRQPIGETVGTSKLQAGQVRQIRKLAETGVSQRQLAKMYKMSKTMIGHVVHRRFWNHVSD